MVESQPITASHGDHRWLERPTRSGDLQNNIDRSNRIGNGRYTSKNERKIDDIVGSRQRAWRLISTLLVWVFVHPCTSHCGNVILKSVRAVDSFNEMLTWMLEVNDMFVGPHLPRVLLRKQPVKYIGHKLACLRSCNARFGLNIFLCCRLLRLHSSLMSVVADARWVENFDKPSAKHPVKVLILDDARWSRAIKLLEVVFPVALIVKLGDFHKPALSRLYP